MLNLTSLLGFNFKWPTMVPAEVLALTLLMVFAILSTLEFQAPREKLPKKHLRQSYKTNIGLFIVNSIGLSLVSASTLLVLAERYSDKGLFKHILQSCMESSPVVFNARFVNVSLAQSQSQL